MTNKARSRQRLGKRGGAMPPYEPRGAELTQESSSGPVRTNNGTVTLRNDEYIFHLSFGCVILHERGVSLLYFTD